MEVVKYILIYLAILNVIGFLMMGIDKLKAKRHEFRIPEAALFMVAAFGGSIGSILGMYTFRHKTKHKSFVIGMPAILIVQILIVVGIYLSPLEIVFFQ